MKSYRFESLRNLFEHGLEPVCPAIHHLLADDADAVEVAERILNRGEADMVRVTEIVGQTNDDGQFLDRLVREVFA